MFDYPALARGGIKLINLNMSPLAALQCPPTPRNARGPGVGSWVIFNIKF